VSNNKDDRMLDLDELEDMTLGKDGDVEIPSNRII
jgi:hypothetical protein